MAGTMYKSSLCFNIIAECSTSKARISEMKLPHYTVETPVFMPVGTKGAMKGILPEQLEALDYQIILANTYHMGTTPGPELLKKAGGLHKFMGWNRALLTDSGGFQMVSLLNLAEITEEGVKFKSPYGGSDCMLTPENSIKIQNAIGADIIMQLDDVLKTTTEPGPRVEEATYRTTRWLDRCIAAHERPEDQTIFPIVQGLLDEDLRIKSVQMHMERQVNGFAIGGLSGGESKDDFWRIVLLCTSALPKDKPRYVMGVGFAVDMVVCCALGVDMFDCVFPTRTARFGCALIHSGQLNLRLKKFEVDFNPIDSNCNCITCTRYTRAYLHSIVNHETVACHLLTIHNLAFIQSLMKTLRNSIKQNRFPEFVQNFMKNAYPCGRYPTWVIEALQAVNILILEKKQSDSDASHHTDGGKLTNQSTRSSQSCSVV